MNHTFVSSQPPPTETDNTSKIYSNFKWTRKLYEKGKNLGRTPNFDSHKLRDSAKFKKF